MSPRSRSTSAPSTRRAAPIAQPASAAAWLRPWQVALGLGVLHAVLGLLVLDPTPHEGGDNAAYLGLARSLLERGTYQELWDPAMRPHTQYPPGWPLMMAGALLAGVKPWVGFKVLTILFSAAAVALSYLWARRVTTAGVALGTAAVLAIGPGVVDLARWELSDIPFWCFTMLALWAFARLEPARTDAGASPPARDAADARYGILALAAGATVLAYATRSAGVPLVLGAAGWLAWRRRWRGLALFAAVVGPYAAWWWARGRALGGGGYTGHLWSVDPYQPHLGTVGAGGMLARIGRNLVEYTGDHLPYLLTGSRMTTTAIATGVAVVLLAAAGWALRLRRAGPAEIWLPLYMGLVLVWPSEWSSDRFLLPALPMLVVCAGEVVARAGRRMGQPLLLGAGLAGVLAAGGAPPLVRLAAQGSVCRAAYGPHDRHPCLPEPWRDYMRMAASLRGRLPEGAGVLARKPTLFWAESGYFARPYPFAADPDTLLAQARRARARYVVLDYLDNVSVLYLAPVLIQRPQAFCVMEAVGTGRATLMAIRPGAERMPNVRGQPGEETVTLGFALCGPEFWRPGAAPPDGGEAAPEQAGAQGE